MLNDPQTFCSSRGVGLSDFAKEEPWRPPSLILEADPPAHTPDPCRAQSRAVTRGDETVARSFHGRRRSQGRRTRGQGTFDAITDLAEAYPLSVFPDALGLEAGGPRAPDPLCGPRVQRSSGRRTNLRQKAIERSAPHMAYVQEQCQRENLAPRRLRRLHPVPRVDDGEITATEAPLLVRSLLSAGLDTTVNGLGAAVYCLARFPSNGRGCATTSRWPATLSRKRSGWKARCRHSSEPPPGRWISAAFARRRREGPDVPRRCQPRSAAMGESGRLRHHTAHQRPRRIWRRHPYVRRPVALLASKAK